jgi:hypothetical protein
MKIDETSAKVQSKFYQLIEKSWDHDFGFYITHALMIGGLQESAKQYVLYGNERDNLPEH